MDIRSSILAACKELAIKHGFRGIRMDELARRAGVSKRTVYRYFPSKDAVIAGALDDFMQQIESESERILSGEGNPAAIMAQMQKYLLWQGHFAINDHSMRDLQDHYTELWQKMDQFRSLMLRKFLAHIAHSAGSQLLDEMDYQIAETMILAGIQSVINPDFMIRNRLSFEEAMRPVSSILLYGLLPR